MDLAEMVDHLEKVVRDESIPASSRIRAVEVLLRIGRTAPEDAEWQRLVAEFGGSE